MLALLLVLVVLFLDLFKVVNFMGAGAGVRRFRIPLDTATLLRHFLGELKVLDADLFGVGLRHLLIQHRTVFKLNLLELSTSQVQFLDEIEQLFTLGFVDLRLELLFDKRLVSFDSFALFNEWLFEFLW